MIGYVVTGAICTAAGAAMMRWHDLSLRRAEKNARIEAVREHQKRWEEQDAAYDRGYQCAHRELKHLPDTERLARTLSSRRVEFRTEPAPPADRENAPRHAGRRPR